MGLRIKISRVGLQDMLFFKNLPLTREQKIEEFPAKDVDGTFAINENAKLMHPDFQHMVIDEVITHGGAGAKTFVLKKEDGSEAAFFRAGQYISVLLNIGGSLVTRPYSICSSPALAKEGKIAITVKENPGGFAADFILGSWAVGDKVTVSGAEGTFYYEELRDSANVIALAGGSGITPFLSMAKAIRDGIEDFNLTILFGSRTKDAVLFGDELDGICAECEKVKVVYVLSEEEADGCEKGFITAELIKKYAPENNDYSLFICGPEAMYKFLEGETEKLGLAKGRIRRELLGVSKNIAERADYPAECKGRVFKLTVLQGCEKYETTASADETLLTAIERAGIAAPSRCRSGECGWCRSKLVSGSVYTPEENDGRRFADIKFGYIHPCACFPTDDTVIEVPGSYLK